MTSAPVTPAPPAVPAARLDAAGLPAGHRLKEYRIVKTLGGGGFGITCLARDVNLDLPVAIKEYFPGERTFRAADLAVHVRHPEGRQQFAWGLERFLDEARALASFRHSNIARVLRYFQENGTAYIVMEYESGESLRRWLAQQPALERATLLQVIHPLLDGLEAVHRLDFLHRDVKPDNIYMRGDGTPVLLDFGAARRSTSGRELTAIESPGFAPFEQHRSHGKQGPWSDIHALGTVMALGLVASARHTVEQQVSARGLCPPRQSQDPTRAPRVQALATTGQPAGQRRHSGAFPAAVLALVHGGAAQPAGAGLEPGHRAAVEDAGQAAGGATPHAGSPAPGSGGRNRPAGRPREVSRRQPATLLMLCF